MKNEVTVNAVEQFKEAWEMGFGKILDACKIYVTAIDKNKTAKDDFVKNFPFIHPSVWSNIEACGRGIIHFKLMISMNPASQKAKLLPYSTQEAIINNGIDVLTVKGDVLKIQLDNLTPEQIKQVFNGNELRDISSQRAWIESIKMVEMTSKKKACSQWTIKGTSLVVMEPMTFTRQELARIMAEIA